MADLFMAFMWSRPQGLSLRTSWVTPATIGLCGAIVMAVGGAGVGALVYGLIGRNSLVVLGSAVLLGLAAGAAVVAWYGVRQRLLGRSRDR